MSKGGFFWRGAESHSIYAFKCALEKVTPRSSGLLNTPRLPGRTPSPVPTSHASLQILMRRPTSDKKYVRTIVPKDKDE